MSLVERNLSKYQVVHLAKLLSNGHNSLLISDGVGVGKTVSAGYVIYYVNKILLKPVVVLCPPMLENKWKMDMELRLGLNSKSAKKKEDFDLMCEEIRKSHGKPKIYILPYSTCSRRKVPSGLEIGLIVMDEVHHARNPSTKLYKSLYGYCNQSEYRIGLSATPVQNSIDDLASALSLLIPQGEYDIWRLFIGEIWRRGELSILSPFVTKFTKDRLGFDFTERKIHQIEMEYPASYVNSVEMALEKIGKKRGKKLSSFEKMTYLRLSSSSPNSFFGSLDRKISKDYPNPKIDRLIQLLDTSEDGRWIIFTEFRKTAELIISNLEGETVSLISGDSSFSDRYLAFDDFRKDPNGILVMMPVGSEGLDLQACHRMINFDLHWNPMVLEQRIGRIDRLGQEKKEVEIYNFVVIGSLDEHMMVTLRSKLDIVKDTFASTEKVISDNSQKMSLSNIPLDDELKKLETYLEGLKYYSQVPEDDYELINSLEDRSCECENWGKISETWIIDNLLLGNGKSLEILNKYSKDANEPMKILHEYIG